MDNRVIEVPNRLDATNAEEFERNCRSAAGTGCVELNFDFANVQYVSSLGLRSILAIGKEVVARGGTLTLLNLSGVVRQTFELAGFLALFPHRP